MTLTPGDVEQKTFSTALRGYDLDEVDDFLDEVVITIKELNEQAASAATAPAAAVESRAAPSGADESAIGRALITAQQKADEIIADARQQAEQIIEDARGEADTMISEKEERKAAAQAEMVELAEHVAGVRSRLAVLATAVADRLDEMDAAIESSPEGHESPDGRHRSHLVAVEPDEETDDASSPLEDSEDIDEFALDDFDHDEQPGDFEDETASGDDAEDEAESPTESGY